MKQNRNRGSAPPGLAKKLTLALALAAIGPSLHAADESSASDRFKVDGYLREELSINTKNWADTPDYNDRGKLSMARTTLRLNADWKPTDSLSIVAKWRGSREARTSFLKHLEEMGANNSTSGGPGTQGDIMDLYNKAEMRELYVDYQATDRIKLRFGKQQIAWGETDFFAANDLVHGFNYTWRSFLEPANEELRKTNIIAKLNVDIPELDGGIEAFIRPGWDSKKDIGTELDIYGGRWSSQPYAGVDFRNIDPYNWNNSKGDYKKPTGGVRWSGNAFDLSYSLSYLRTFWPGPMMNASSNLKLFGLPGVPSGATTVGGADTIGLAGEVIYPIVNVFGMTGSGYAAWADAVFSSEVAYIPEAPYQKWIPTPISQAVAPGFDGLMNKKLLTWMLRMDKNIAATQSILGSEKPMFFSVQLFDKWILDYDKSDNLVNAVGWGAKTKEHSFLLTGIFSLSYNNGRIKPEFVIGTDLTYKGGFYVPSVTVELSKNLKWKTEYDGTKCGFPNGATCDNTGLFGYFHNRDQLYTSLTYQF